MKRIVIVYHSTYGHTEAVGRSAQQGAHRIAEIAKRFNRP